jgi:cell wall-associated NlpC family hydrolase
MATALFFAGTLLAETVAEPGDAAFTGGAGAKKESMTTSPLTNRFDGEPTNESGPIPTPISKPKEAALKASDLIEYDQSPQVVRALIDRALILSMRGLSYRFGSDDPANGGMDCSGTVRYLLIASGWKNVPRDSGEFYRWLWEDGRFNAVQSRQPDTFELSRLRPGDLLFWTGTYDVRRDPPISHVMIYLGTSRISGRGVMIGASEGRTFNDQRRSGVGLFDFKITSAAREPSGAREPRFIGYGTPPGAPDVPPPSTP